MEESPFLDQIPHEWRPMIIDTIKISYFIKNIKLGILAKLTEMPLKYIANKIISIHILVKDIQDKLFGNCL